MIARRPARLIIIGFRRWRRYNLAPILQSQAGSVHFVRDARAAAKLHPTAADRLCWWSAQAPDGVEQLAQATGTPTLRIEDGFYRSVGLGSDLIPPMSLVLDSRGIYFDPRQPSDLEHILSTETFPAQDLERARQIRSYIVQHGLTKYNLEPRKKAEWRHEGRAVILVPGQVEDDASIRFGCRDVRTNTGLLRAVRADNPDAYIVYKPHPDVLARNRKGAVALSEASRWADAIETGLSVISCIDASDEVHVMTSQAGFDALLRNKKVTTYGQPFYAGWGLTDDRNPIARRRRLLSIDELIAATLLYYPLYWDIESNSVSQCETILKKIQNSYESLISNGKLDELNNGFHLRIKRKMSVIFHSLFPMK